MSDKTIYRKYVFLALVFIIAFSISWWTYDFVVDEELETSANHNYLGVGQTSHCEETSLGLRCNLSLGGNGSVGRLLGVRFEDYSWDIDCSSFDNWLESQPNTVSYEFDSIESRRRWSEFVSLSYRQDCINGNYTKTWNGMDFEVSYPNELKTSLGGNRSHHLYHGMGYYNRKSDICAIILPNGSEIHTEANSIEECRAKELAIMTQWGG